MPRQARIDFPGALHHIISRGIKKEHIFRGKFDKKKFIQRLTILLSKTKMKCYAWCVMSNHFHLLLVTGAICLSEFMRRLLTGYAVYYNQKHKRAGYVFQNRYTSILCDKDSYFLQLVRYIHLNPVKSKIIGFKLLNDYPWTSHHELVCGQKDIIEREEILEHFGSEMKSAIKSYNNFLVEGLEMNEDYEGGGLVRSGEGIGEVVSRKKDEYENFDARILGDGSFVDDIFSGIDKLKNKNKIIHDLDWMEQKIKKYFNIEDTVSLQCKAKRIREARDWFAYLARVYLGKDLRIIGRFLSIKASSVCMAVKRVREQEEVEGKIEQIMN